VVAARWFLSAAGEARRWEGSAYAVLSAFMAFVNLVVLLLLVFPLDLQ